MKHLIFIILLSLSSVFANEEMFQHKVVSGETLMTISNTYYNTHQCWQIILDNNSALTESKGQIEKGQMLAIPSRSECKHPRARIAEKMPTAEPKIAPANKIAKNKIAVSNVEPVQAIKAYSPVWKDGEMLQEIGARQQIANPDAAPDVPVVMKKKIKAAESNSKPENKKVVKVVDNKSNAQTTPAVPVKAQNILHRQGQLQLMQKNTKNREYFIQLKSVRDKMLAKEACQNYKKLLGDGFECHLDLFSKNKNELFWRVQWGPFSSHQKALETLGQVKNKWKVVDAFIVNPSN